jgi:hypothetical protein
MPNGIDLLTSLQTQIPHRLALGELVCFKTLNATILASYEELLQHPFQSAPEQNPDVLANASIMFSPACLVEKELRRLRTVLPPHVDARPGPMNYGSIGNDYSRSECQRLDFTVNGSVQVITRYYWIGPCQSNCT